MPVVYNHLIREETQSGRGVIIQDRTQRPIVTSATDLVGGTTVEETQCGKKEVIGSGRECSSGGSDLCVATFEVIIGARSVVFG